MAKLLIIADDFTGALDTGVQFAARGASTRVVTDPAYDFSKAEADIQVLVLDAETRHLSAEEAYRVVYRIARSAWDAGVSNIYKKTDSALRGNIGSELAAVMNAVGADRIPFLPAFPKMGRTTRGGIHYVDGVPVAQSVFGRDPFEPVRHSDIRSILAEQTDLPIVLCNHSRMENGPGIQVYDAQTDEDLRLSAETLGAGGLRISAGCAGFGHILADMLALDGVPPKIPDLKAPLFVVCGSVNPVTVHQLKTAEQNGFCRFCLTPEKKLEPNWLKSPSCETEVMQWIELARRGKDCILDANDAEGSQTTTAYAKKQGLTIWQLRTRIAATLGGLVKRLLDSGLEATILCTGGDTLLAMIREIGVSELTPICEVAVGSVLTSFVYRERRYHIISKSGGFGEPELLCTLAAQVRAKTSGRAAYAE